MAKLSLRIHPSMAIEDHPRKFKGEFSDSTILAAILELLNSCPPVKDLCILDGHPRPGILYFSDKTELTSLGLMDAPLDDDLEIRVVPILHGGCGN